MNTDQSNDKNQNPVKESNLNEDEIVNSEQPEHPKMGAKNEVTSYKGMTEETNILTEKSGGAMISPVDSNNDEPFKEDSTPESNDREMLNQVDEFSNDDTTEEQEAPEDDNGDVLQRNGD